MRNFVSVLLGAAALFYFYSNVYAQDAALPEMPEPIRNLVSEGAQARYLGRDYGFDSWITIKAGQEQYFYVLPDQSAFVMGLLFNPKGDLVTMEQVQRLRAKGDETLDALAADDFGLDRRVDNLPDLNSPSERLYYDIENSNWVPLGTTGAPVMYAFIDPQCGHCHAFVDDLRSRDMLKGGKVQVRLIPVGFREETIAQAAYLLATPDPQGRFLRHLDGDEEALPAKSEISDQGVQRNLAVMQSWKFDATPMIVYRGKDGSVKLVRGRPKDIDALVADIGARS